MRAKWMAVLAARQAEAQLALQRLQDCQVFVNDLAMAFYGGDGRVVMTEDALYTAPEDHA